MRKIFLSFLSLILFQSTLLAQISKTDHSSEKIKFVFSKDVKDFVSQISYLGSKGYRLITVTKMPLVDYQEDGKDNFNQTKYTIKETDLGLAGILTLGKNSYDYDFFEEKLPQNIAVELEKRGKKGFSLIEALPYWGNSELKLFGKQVKIGNEKANLPNICQVNHDFTISVNDLTPQKLSTNIFLLEKKLSETTSEIKYQVIFDEKRTTFFDDWRKEYRQEVIKNLENSLLMGFNPILTSATKPAFFITSNHHSLKNSGNVELNIVGNFRDLKKLKKQNFFPMIFSENLFLVAKDSQQSPKNYEFYESDNQKSYSAKIDKYYAKGWRYKSVGYTNQMSECDFGYMESILLFEKDIQSLHKYKSVVIRLNDRSYIKSNDLIVPQPDLIAISKVNKLIDEGYEVRDLFYNYGVNIILDKPLD